MLVTEVADPDRDPVWLAADGVPERVAHGRLDLAGDLRDREAVGDGQREVDGEPLWDTFEYIWAEMPEDDPASLDPEEYAAVLAYIFESYGLPPGTTALPTDRATLSGISIAAP